MRQVDAHFATLTSSLSTVDLEIRRLEKAAQKRLANFQGELDAAPTHARKILATLAAGKKLSISRVAGRFRVDGPLSVPELLLSGTDPDCLVSPAGFGLYGTETIPLSFVA